MNSVSEKAIEHAVRDRIIAALEALHPEDRLQAEDYWLAAYHAGLKIEWPEEKFGSRRQPLLASA